MRLKTTALVWAAALVFSMPAVAQQDLSEVAGKIKLKGTEEGEPLVIDGKTVGSTRRPYRSREPGEVLLEAAESCSNSAHSLFGLVSEIGSKGTFSNEDWRNRLDTVGTQFENASEVLSSEYVPERFTTAYKKAERGVLNVRSGLTLLRGSVNESQPFLIDANTQLSDGIQFLDEAVIAMRTLVRRVEEEQTAEDIDPLAATLGIETLCGRRYGEASSERYQKCVAKQEAARDAIEGRYAFEFGIDDAEFNAIRNSCAFEWPSDFVQRDFCENSRVAAAPNR